MAEEETNRAQAADFLANELARETQSYLERGRRLQGLTDAQLASKWVADFRSWRASRAATDDPGNFADLDDTAAELRLRNLEAPSDQVQSEVNAMVQEIEHIGPDQPPVSAKVQQFRDDLSERKNCPQGQQTRESATSRMPWTRKFPKPIKLKDGRKIANLGQARELMLALPERHQPRPFWQYAAELLIDAAESSNPASVGDAQAQLSRALAAEGLL
jgi:hypothetical protein